MFYSTGPRTLLKTGNNGCTSKLWKGAYTIKLYRLVMHSKYYILS